MSQNSAAATPDDSSYSLPDGRGRIAVVLGASGYMGSNVVPALAAHGWPWERLAALLPVTDLVMMDVKLMDSARHQACTGVPNARILMDRSWLTTFSTFCTYAGNTLLMKKGNHRFAVDFATYYGQDKELSEHMFITGLEGPGGRRTYIAGAAPSGCGKTTTAMGGTAFVGDDLAQIWIAADGTCRGVNPECGIFGIVEDVNREGDPHLMKALRDEDTEAIWSNVLVSEDGVPYWTGNGEPPPAQGRNFQGPWRQGMVDANGKAVPISHPNARCTLSFCFSVACGLTKRS